MKFEQNFFKINIESSQNKGFLSRYIYTKEDILTMKGIKYLLEE